MTEWDGPERRVNSSPIIQVDRSAVWMAGVVVSAIIGTIFAMGQSFVERVVDSTVLQGQQNARIEERLSSLVEKLDGAATEMGRRLDNESAMVQRQIEAHDRRLTLLEQEAREVVGR